MQDTFHLERNIAWCIWAMLCIGQVFTLSQVSMIGSAVSERETGDWMALGHAEEVRSISGRLLPAPPASIRVTNTERGTRELCAAVLYSLHHHWQRVIKFAEKEPYILPTPHLAEDGVNLVRNRATQQF